MVLLYTHTLPQTDPLDPATPLIIGAGLLSGAPVPTAARMNISGRSPETGLLGDSNIGGHFAPLLRQNGYDHLVITGKAPQPVYLSLEQGKISLLDAASLWGRDTLETLELLQRRHGPASQSLVIGPAGENLVRFATIRHGRKNTAGRTGLGCLMGAKNLKAIVAQPGPALDSAYPQELIAYARELTQRLKKSRTSEVLHRLGTPFLYDLHNQRGILRTRNALLNQFKEGRGLRSPHLKKYYTETRGCFACPIRCHHSYRFPGRDQTEITGYGFEYGVLGSLGPVCGLGNLEGLLRLNELLNRLGLDAASTGNLIAWAMELFQRGLLTRADTDGLELTWGDEEVITRLIEQIVYRQGLGAILADGARAAAGRWGPEAAGYLIWSKYLPQSDSVDLRAFKGFALGVATASRGADHLRSRPTLEALNLTAAELAQHYGPQVSPDPTSYQGKAQAVWHSEIAYALADALGLCRFAQNFNSTNHMNLTDFSRLISYATGLDLSEAELRRIGERIITLERLFLMREGLDRRNDTLPDRYFDEPLPLGPYQGEHLDRKAFETMLTEYYHLHNWDVATGNPSAACLEELNLTNLTDLVDAP
ncbi:MAG: aldehyde:ferredoxin oxidoreductase [Deltaproteobacteria bacterium]|nr:aldehyde:ferredoxin oxidoreductase [Deltaproteobacteria bacterium]